MKHLTDQLYDFIVDAPNAKSKRDLTIAESRIFKLMKTHGERSIKGREVSNTIFEAKVKADIGTSFLMIMEGRHSMSVGGQISRRFEGMDGVDSVEVVKTRKGACVILRPERTEIQT